MSDADLELIIGTDGTVRAIYDDRLVDIFGDNPSSTRRASHVEPVDGGWEADLAPVGGPTLGPFRTRRAALDAEIAWIRTALEEGRIT